MFGINKTSERDELSLFELNKRIKGVIDQAFAATYWVRAEMSDVRTNVSGHCYLEFVEKNAVNGQIIAKARASVWAKTFRMLKPYFEMETGQSFASGIKVLVKVSVEFHELYGFSLNVLDIDPAYTVGDMLRKRMEIIRRLQQEGVFTLNKELPFPDLPVRIAIITSPTAAGYEDFMRQLTENKAGYAFYTQLFPAVMQGDKTESSIIAALDRVNEHIDCFDVVVIIRGGGATSDLNSFDSYLLAANCAQFPLPLITGIGHERDDTVLDMVAHTRMKTPTAVAEYLIGCMDRAAEEVYRLQVSIVSFTKDTILAEKNRLQLLGTRFPSSVINRIERNRSQLHMLGNRLPVIASGLLERQRHTLLHSATRLQQVYVNKMAEDKRFIQLTEQFVRMASPDYILQKGYSLTYKDGRIMKRSADVVSGDELVTRFMDGEVTSVVKD